MFCELKRSHKNNTAFVLIISIIILININIIKSRTVCTCGELRRQLKADPKMTCLVQSEPTVGKIDETYAERSYRVNKDWSNSPCAMFVTQDIVNEAIAYYGLPKGLVDINGKPLRDLPDNESHICVLIRSMAYEGFFGISYSEINEDAFDLIECVGHSLGFDCESQICAATIISPAREYGWNIFLSPTSITTTKLGNVQPQWILDDKSKDAIDNRRTSISG